MQLWNYIHYTLGLHFYVLPAIFVILITAIVCVLHIVLSKKRRSEHEFSQSLKYGNTDNSGEDY